MSRYPYTDAADYIRSEVSDWTDVGGMKMKMPTISRSQASQAQAAIAAALGMDRHELACKLADYAAREPNE